MNNSQLAAIQEMVKKEVAKTEKAIADYREMTAPIAPDDAIGRVSRMDAINNKSVAEAALRTAESKLRGLIEIENKIGEKDFGQCAKCKREIPIQRILLMPHIRYCVGCAQ